MLKRRTHRAVPIFTTTLPRLHNSFLLPTMVLQAYSHFTRLSTIGFAQLCISLPLTPECYSLSALVRHVQLEVFRNITMPGLQPSVPPLRQNFPSHPQLLTICSLSLTSRKRQIRCRHTRQQYRLAPIQNTSPSLPCPCTRVIPHGAPIVDKQS